MAKQLGLPHRPWITLINTNNVREQESERDQVWLQSMFLNVTCVVEKLWIVVWLVVWLDRVCVKVQTPHMRVCLCLYMPLYLLHVPLCIYVHYVGVSHTPAGLWSPESEEDMDTEQRRLLATLEPWSMLGWKPACRRACLVRWSLLMKHLSHSGQLKRFSPVCVR